MQWANAADVFTSYGISDKLVKCVRKDARNYIGSSGVVKSIESISKNISYSRSIEILKGNIFSKANEKLNESEHNNLQPAFKPILEKVIDKIAAFKNDSALNFIPAVKWCIAHEMVPQGITMLQEGIISFVIDKHGFNYTDRELRMAISSYFNKDEKSNFIESESQTKYKQELEIIFGDSFVKEIKPTFLAITPTRNDINHGGTNEASSGSTEKLFNNLKKRFEEVEAIFGKYNLF